MNSDRDVDSGFVDEVPDGFLTAGGLSVKLRQRQAKGDRKRWTARQSIFGDVAKTYRRKVQALRGIQMRVMPGEIFGLLGPNGAGKSTLVKIMMSVVRPTRAEGTLLGRPLGHKPTLARGGLLARTPPHAAVSHRAAGPGVLRRPGPRGSPHPQAAAPPNCWKWCGWTQWSDARLRTYSKGMQQRIALAQALMNDPDLVVLDEPTDGLDPVGRKETRDVLQRLRAEGKTMFLNSHLLGEVEQLCDRVAILVEGRVVRQGTIAEMTAGSAPTTMIELAGDDLKRHASRGPRRPALRTGPWSRSLPTPRRTIGSRSRPACSLPARP